MAEFDNIAGIMANSKPLPSYAEQQAQASQAQYYGAEAQRTQTQNQALQYQNQMARYQFARQQQYINDAHTMSHQQLAAKYPDMVEQIKKNFDSMHDINQTQTRTMLGSAVSLAQGGHYTDAADYLDQQHALAQQSGQEDEFSPYVTSLLRSSNPADQAAGKRMLAHTLLSTYDPKEAPANAKALGISEEPVITKGGDTATNPLMGGSTYNPLPGVLATTKFPNGASVESIANPNPTNQNVTNGGAFGEGAAGGMQGVTPAPAGAGDNTSAPPQGSADASGLTGIIHNIESGGLGDYNPDGTPLVNKSSGARYGMQVMPATAAKPGYGVKPAASNTAAEYNRVGTQLFQAHLDHYGDPLKAAAAYQAGRGNLNKAMVAAAKAGDPNSWMNYLGPDGRKYVHNFATQMASLGGQGGTQVASNAPLVAPQGSPAPAGTPPAQMAGGFPAAGQVAPAVDPTPPGFREPIQGEPGMSWADAGHTRETFTPGGSEDPNSYPKTQLESWARDTLLGRPLPFQGTSGTAVKKVVAGISDQLMGKLGLTPQQLNLIRAKNTAYTNAYGPTMNQLSSLQSSEDALQSNVQQVRQTAKALQQLGVTHGSPFVNEHMLNLAEQGGTQAQKDAVQRYRTAINGVAGEYAKFMSSSSGQGGGAPTDSMKHQADDVVNAHLNNGTLNAGMDQILTEATNKRQSVQTQKDFLERHIADPFGEHAPPAGAVAMLRANPQLRAQFDAKYGHGASVDALGH